MIETVYIWLVLWLNIFYDVNTAINSKHREIDEKIVDNKYIGSTLNKNKISRLETKLYIDVGIMFEQTVINSFKEQDINIEAFLGEMSFELSKIFSWSNIDWSIKHFDIIEINTNAFSSQLQFYFSIYSLGKTEIRNPLDIYLLYYNSSSPTLHGSNVNSYYCSEDSIKALNIIFMDQQLSGKNFAEITAKYFPLNPDIPTSLRNDCKCPYIEKSFCLNNFEENELSNSSITKIFTNCETDQIISISLENPCFSEKDPRPRYYQKCGDGVVDEGTEDCDCGTHDMCVMTEQAHCCDYKECKFLNPTYQCSEGICCENCLFKKGNTCRKSYDDCDPLESCNGISSECPRDEIYEHYTMCNDNKGVCINGMCSNFKSLCQYVYKNENVSFDKRCYDFMIKKLREDCEKDVIVEELKYTCDKFSLCDHFICSSISPLDSINPVTYIVDDIYCIIPSDTMLVGWFIHSPNCIECEINPNYFCMNSNCTNDKSKLKNCNDERCYMIDNSIYYVMNKSLSMQLTDVHLHEFNYKIYVHTIPKIVIKKLLYVPKWILICIASCTMIVACYALFFLTTLLIRKKTVFHRLETIKY